MCRKSHSFSGKIFINGSHFKYHGSRFNNGNIILDITFPRPHSGFSRLFSNRFMRKDSYSKRGGRIWIRVFPHKPVTKKPAETRMGSGKGNVEYYVAIVKPGTVIFEMGAVDENLAREAMRLAAPKLPIKPKIFSRRKRNT